MSGSTGIRTNDNADISIIVVTYGARDMTLACLRSLEIEAAAVGGQVIVVDNAAPGGLADEIASLHPDFLVLRQVRNLGFAAAANLGACVSHGRYLLLLNPDTKIPAGALARLLDTARGSAVGGLWGVRTCFGDGTGNPTSCRRKPTLWRLLCSGLGLDTAFPRSPLLSGMGYSDFPQAGLHAVDVVCGVCLLVEKKLWDRLGGFSPAFFMYGEDDDLNLRAARLGYRSTLVADVCIVHHGSGTEPNQARKVSQILAARALLIGGHFSLPARQIGRTLLSLRPFLAKHFSKRELRPIWQIVWTNRRQWLAGRFG